MRKTFSSLGAVLTVSLVTGPAPARPSPVPDEAHAYISLPDIHEVRRLDLATGTLHTWATGVTVPFYSEWHQDGNLYMQDFGFRAVVSTSFADIFRNNALKNGLLPVIVDAETHRQLFSLVEEEPDTQIAIDLASQTLRLPDGRGVTFPIDEFSKTCLLEGIDQLGYLLKHETGVVAYEGSHPPRVNTAIR